MPNPGYQGTRDFNPQMGQQVRRNPNLQADELLLRVIEMMKNQFGLKPKGLTFSYNAHTQNGMIWSLFLQITDFRSLLASLAKTVQAQ